VLDRLTDQTEPLVEAASNGKLDRGELARLRTVTVRQEAALEQAEHVVAPEALPQLAQAQAVSRRGSVIAAIVQVNQSDGPAVITPEQPLETAALADSTPTTTPADGETVTPEATPTSEPPPVPTRSGLVLDETPIETTNGVTWIRLAVGNFNTLMPSREDGWQVLGVSVLDGSQPAPTLVRISNRDGTSLVTMNPRNGDMYWFVAINGIFDEVQMRATRDGQVFVADRELVTRLYGPLAAIPLYILDHIEIIEPPPTATPTRTPQPTETPAP
jgi:hypothetical protein